jgi:serine/threonine protein kinase
MAYQAAKIGEGAFGKVYKVWSTEKQKMAAVKKLTITDDEASKKIEHEIAALQSVQKGCQNTNMICIFDSFRKNNHMYIVMEYLPKSTDLYDCIERSKITPAFKPEVILIVFIKLVRALYVMHNHAKIAHMDIKPENILISQNQNSMFTVKLLDMGLACLYKNKNLPESETFCNRSGSPGWAALELFVRERLPTLEEAKQCDMWSLGMVLFVLTYKGNPMMIEYSPRANGFSANMEKAYKRLIDTVKYIDVGDSPCFTKISKEILLSCLSRDPLKRCTISELRTKMVELIQKSELKSKDGLVRELDSILKISLDPLVATSDERRFSHTKLVDAINQVEKFDAK